MRGLAIGVLLTGCSGAAPAPEATTPVAAERVDGTPDLVVLDRWLTELGAKPEQSGDVLRVGHAGADATFGIVVQPMPDDHVVWLTTEPLIRLRDAADERAIAVLLTSLAVLNYETLEGKLQLEPRTGGVLLSLELPTDEGLGKATFLDAVRTLEAKADAVVPRLRAAAAGTSL